MPFAFKSLWPFRRRPLGDIAQGVLELMADESQWRSGLLALHHQSADLTVRNTGLFLSVAVGEASLRLEGRDRYAVDRAYRRLKRRLTAHGHELRAERLRQAMALRREEPALLPSPGEESIEAVEARVRSLRDAIILRT